jgi:hypothetical protein
MKQKADGSQRSQGGVLLLAPRHMAVPVKHGQQEHGQSERKMSERAICVSL